LCRFLSVDPLAPKYPELTTYQFASNTPIMAIDLDGLERADATTGQISGNIQFNFNAGSNLNPEQQSSFMCDFKNDITNIYNGYQVGGNTVNASNLNCSTTQSNNSATNCTVNVGNFPISNANSASGTINLNIADWNPATGAFRAHSAAHEFGHLLGLSDRYINGGIFTTSDWSTAFIPRFTLPINNIPGDPAPGYNYLNNLYSTGTPVLTQFQINIIFSGVPEKDYNHGCLGYYFNDIERGFDGIGYQSSYLKDVHLFNRGIENTNFNIEYNKKMQGWTSFGFFNRSGKTSNGLTKSTKQFGVVWQRLSTRFN
jgi:hypothetical protein